GGGGGGEREGPRGEWCGGMETEGPVGLGGRGRAAAPGSSQPATLADGAELIGAWAGQLERPIPGGRRFYPAVLKITEDGSRLRGELDVTGKSLEAAGLGADNLLYRLPLQKR